MNFLILIELVPKGKNVAYPKMIKDSEGKLRYLVKSEEIRPNLKEFLEFWQKN